MSVSLFSGQGQAIFHTRLQRKPRDWSWSPPENEGARKRTERINYCRGDCKQIAKVTKRRDYWRKLGFNVVIDHIIPLCRMGAHTATNMQIIYAHENSRKRGSLSYKPRVIFC